MLAVSSGIQAASFGQSNAAHQAVKDNILSGEGAPGLSKPQPTGGTTELAGSKAVEELRDTAQARKLAEQRVIDNIQISMAPQPKPEGLDPSKAGGQLDVSSKAALDDLSRVLAKADTQERNVAFGVKVKVEALAETGPNFSKDVETVRSINDPTGRAGESRLT